MTWEQAPRSPRLHRWRWPAAAVAITVAILVAVTALGSSDPRHTGTLAVQRDQVAVPAAQTLPSADPADLTPAQLDPLETTTETPGEGPLLPDTPDITVVTADDQLVRTIDLATGDVHHLAVNGGITLGLEPRTMFEVGNRIVSTDGEDAVLIAGAGERRTRLARGHWALPTFADSSVWVVDGRGAGPQTVVKLELDGTVIDRVTLPAAALPHVGIDDGVLVSSPGGVHLVAGDGVRQITTSGQLAAVGHDGRLAWFVCAADLTCELVLGTLDEPDQMRLPLAANELPGGWYALEFGRFSPDGRWLALPMYSFDNGAPPTNSATSIIDTAAGAEVARMQEQTRQPFDAVAAAWSPDSQWLFIGLDDGLAAWDVRSRELTPLDDRNRPLLGVAVVENR